MMNRKDSRTPRRDPSSVKNWIYRRGDIYLVNFDPVIGSEQGGLRPALILQNDVGNYFSSTTVVVPITSHIKKLDLPTHVLLSNVRGLSGTSMACIEQPNRIDKKRIRRYLGKVSKEQMRKIENTLLVEFGLEIPECVEAP